MTRTMLERQISLAKARLENAETQVSALIAADDLESLQKALANLK